MSTDPSPAGTAEWLLVGPSGAKNELLKHIDQHVPQLRGSLVGGHAMDHPAGGQPLDRARRAFKVIDRLLPDTPL